VFYAINIGLVDPTRLLLESYQDADLPHTLERKLSYRVINLILTIVLEAAENIVGPSEPIKYGFDPAGHVHLDVIVLLQAGKGENPTSDIKG
jgi:hypothetical protein